MYDFSYINSDQCVFTVETWNLFFFIFININNVEAMLYVWELHITLQNLSLGIFWGKCFLVDWSVCSYIQHFVPFIVELYKLYREFVNEASPSHCMVLTLSILLLLSTVHLHKTAANECTTHSTTHSKSHSDVKA